MTLNIHGQHTFSAFITSISKTIAKVTKVNHRYFKFLYFLLFLFYSVSVTAQEIEACPCENCPALIEDNLSYKEFQVNIFNVKSNSLSSAGQCVRKVGVKFTHEYSGDIEIDLISPGGDTVLLIGPVTFSQGTAGQTDNRIFDISFVSNDLTAIPDASGPATFYEAIWDNDQPWFGNSILEGSYYPHEGTLGDFDQGNVNGTWTLRIKDFNDERNDEGELLDFYIEFCEEEGLVCDPCLDPEDIPDCVFRIDAGEAIVVPDEVFCLPVYAENVAFLRTLQFPLTWDANVLEFVRVDSFLIENLATSDFDLTNVSAGDLALNYSHTFDTLGLVVADSTPIFNVCYRAKGSVGDSTLLNVTIPPTAIDVDDVTRLTETFDGKVLITVDSTADCVNAIQLCGNTPISIDRTKGPGFDEFEGCTPPFGQEYQSKWFTFDILESGNLEFMVKPKGDALFSYSLYKDNCPSGGNRNPVACELNIPPIGGKIIGLSDDPVQSFGNLGNSSTSFSDALAVSEGEVYFLLVDNFSSNNIGFDLSFAGSAVIGDERLQAKIADPAVLNCNNPTVRLNATESTTGSTYTANWTNVGGAIDFATDFYEPIVTVGGTFILSIADAKSGCVVSDSVEVKTDRVFPEAIINGGGIIDCNSPTLTLNSIGSSFGENFTLKWSNLTTTIPNLPISSELFVEVAGNYELAISNTVNGCVTRDSVLISPDFVEPQLTVSDNFISCLEPEATLSATSTTVNVTYEWTGKQLPTPEFIKDISVKDTGIYNIKVTALNGCTTTNEVYVRDDRVFPDAEAGDAFQLNCFNAINNLNGEGSSTGSSFNYNWETSNGHFVTETEKTNLDPRIDSGGLYILAVTNTSTGCISKDSVVIDTSFVKPFIQIVGDTLLTCANPELIIDATRSDSGDIYNFSWFGGDGNILTDDDTYQPKITKAGSYIFNIENKENGCFSTMVRTITSNDEFPIVIAGKADTLDCNDGFAELSSTGSSIGTFFEPIWTTTGTGTILSAASNTAATQDAGVYIITITNKQNGCSSKDSVIIIENFDKPDIAIPADTLLTCEHPTLFLMANSMTDNTQFEWLFPDGTKSDSAAITAINTGTYAVTVTGANGCVNSANFDVGKDQTEPIISIETPDIITCNNRSVTILGQNSDQGPDLAVLWSTTDGAFVEDSLASVINPIVTKGGVYTLEVRNTLTGCVSVDSVEVTSNQDNPIISIADSIEIFTCSNTSVPLTASTNVENAEFQWKFGIDLLSENPIYEAQSPGIYSILVLNPANNCSTLSSVEVKADTLAPFAEAGTSNELNCSIGSVTLDGSLSDMGPEFAYIWNAPNNEVFSNVLQIEASQGGLYNLIVVNQNNGCRAIDTVRVTEARDNPIADAGNDTIFCSGVEDLAILLGGTLTSQGDNYQYSWWTEKETILGTAINQNISSADTFFLKVINTDNNCESLDSVIVSEKPRPMLTLEKTGAINCTSNEITYLAQSDIPTSKIKWVGRFETFSSAITVTDALLEEEFIAIAEDTLTGCLGESTTIRVTENRIKPLLDAGDDADLICADTLRLDGQSLSFGIEAVTNWRTNDGNIVGNPNELTPVVDAAGTYILRIENTENDCVSEDTMIVTTDQKLPVVQLGEDLILTCNVPIVTIKPDTVSKGNDFYYIWKDANNKIVANTDTLAVDLLGNFELTVIDSSNLCTQSDMVSVFDSLNPPAIEIQEPELITCLNNQVILNANTNLTEGSFKWSTDTGSILGSSNNLDLIVNAAGIYQLEVKNDFSGCEGVKNIIVTDLRASIEIEAGSDKTLTCFNDTTVLAAGTIFTTTENLAFEWTTDFEDLPIQDTTLIFTIDKKGTYYLKVTDTLSYCEAIDSFEVDENIESINYSVGETLELDCSSTFVIIGDLSDSGIENYAYNWTTEDGNILSGADQPLALASTAGLYELFIQNTINGCATTDTQRVENKVKLPDVDVGNVSILTCNIEQLTIGGENTSKGENFVYEWTTDDGFILEGRTTPVALINESGNYLLTVIDTVSKCQKQDSISIEANQVPPLITLPSELDIDCKEDFISIIPTVELPENQLAVEWNTNNGSLLSERQAFVAAVDNPGIYYLSIEDTENNCVSLDSVRVIDNRLFPDVVPLENRMLACSDASITLDAQGSAFGPDIVYEWQDEVGRPLSNNTTLEVDMPGAYLLKVTDNSNSCTSSDTVLISENMDPPTGAFFEIISPTCDGIDDGFIEISEVVGGTGPYRYSISEEPGELISIFSELAPNSYLLTITDELACAWDTTIILSQPKAVEAIIEVSDGNLVTGELATFMVTTTIPESDILEIEWTPTDLFNCFNCTEVTTSFFENTTIGVTITDINNCISSDSLFVEVALASVPNAITPNGDGANDFFIIPQIERNPDEYPDSELIVFNRWGDVLYKASPYDNNWDGRNNKGENLIEGTYYYVLRLDTREGEFMKGDITIIRRE